jgi:hypothetical protein
MKSIPFAIIYIIACITECIFHICCGHVPYRRSPIWNLTRGSLTLSCTTVTQNMTNTFNTLKYKPKYTTNQAFDDIVQEERIERIEKIEKLHKNQKNKNKIDPLSSISWKFPHHISMNNINIFDRMSGPGMTTMECIVTLISMLGGMCYAYSQRKLNWSNFQLVASLMFALINASAVTQCTTPTSKRWYHMNGKLPNYLAYVIALEVAILIFLVSGYTVIL